VGTGAMAPDISFIESSRIVLPREFT